MNCKLLPKFPITVFRMGWYGIPLIVLALFSGSLSAQDIHYSQFYGAPFNVSPSLIGIFDGDIRLMGNIRNQWASVPVDYRTITLAADGKLPMTENGSFFAVSGAFNFDQAGDSRLRYVNLALGGSYTRLLQPGLFATVGVQLGTSQRNFDLNGLIFDEQYDNTTGQPNPNTGNGESFPNLRNGFADLSAGLNFHWQAQKEALLVDMLLKRSKLDIGVGVHHLNRPNQSFDERTTINLPMRISPYAMATIQLGSRFDLVGNLQGQFQSTYEEWLAGFGVKFHLDTNPGQRLAFQLGANYRFHQIGDSYSPAIEVFYRNIRAGFSYDVNISEFDVATKGRSGPEFFVHYTIRRVPKIKAKICPLI